MSGPSAARRLLKLPAEENERREEGVGKSWSWEKGWVGDLMMFIGWDEDEVAGDNGAEPVEETVEARRSSIESGCESE